MADTETFEAELRVWMGPLADVTCEGIAVSERGVIRMVNEQLARMIGGQLKDLMGRSMMELVAPVSREAVEAKRQEGGESHHEALAQRLDGSTFPVELRSKSFRVQGRELRVTTMRDVSSRQWAERALRESAMKYEGLFEGVPVGLYRSTADGRVLDANSALVRMLGYPEKAALLLANTASGYLRQEDRQRWKELLDRDGVVWGFEVQWQRFDGKVIWVRETARVVRDTSGKVSYYEGSIEDITERKRAEESRQVLETQLRQAQKMEAIGTLAGGIAHDFNNILGVILCYSELVRDEVQDRPELCESLDNVLKASHRAKDLVRQILTFSRQAVQERRPTAMNVVVKEVLRLLRSTLPATIEIVPEVEEELPQVMADPSQLHQVLMNLCGNAAQAMHGQVGRLEVRLKAAKLTPALARAHPTLKEGPLVHLTVADTGCGMDAVTLRRIFEPFYTTKAPGEGTGLGLSVVDGIVREYEGVIEVQSAPGEGTTFVIYLPGVVRSAATAPTEFRALPRGKGEKVLLVDDEQALGMVAGHMLRKLGYEPVVSADPLAALALFREQPDTYSLVISDLAMPGMSGADFLARILDVRPGMPVMLATGFPASWTPEKARASGIREVLLKPFDAATLGQTIYRAMRGGVIKAA